MQPAFSWETASFAKRPFAQSCLVYPTCKMALQDASSDNNTIQTNEMETTSGAGDANTRRDISKIVAMVSLCKSSQFNDIRMTMIFLMRRISCATQTKAPTRQVRIVYERALQVFNRSYKLWYNYLRYRRRSIMTKPVTDVAYSHLCDAYERCLVFLNKASLFGGNK
jgi:hypothetical protein